MCYSTQVLQEYRKYIREFNVKIDMASYIELFWNRLDHDRIRIPKAMELAFCTQEDLTDESARPIWDATEARRIASAKIDWTLTKPADLRRTEQTDEDARIYPGSWANRRAMTANTQAWANAAYVPFSSKCYPHLNHPAISG